MLMITAHLLVLRCAHKVQLPETTSAGPAAATLPARKDGRRPGLENNNNRNLAWTTVTVAVVHIVTQYVAWGVWLPSTIHIEENFPKYLDTRLTCNIHVEANKIWRQSIKTMRSLGYYRHIRNLLMYPNQKRCANVRSHVHRSGQKPGSIVMHGGQAKADAASPKRRRAVFSHRWRGSASQQYALDWPQKGAQNTH